MRCLVYWLSGLISESSVLVAKKNAGNYNFVLFYCSVYEKTEFTGKMEF